MTQDRIKELLERHIQRIEREISNRRKRDNTYSRVRITYFLIALFAVIFFLRLSA